MSDRGHQSFFRQSAWMMIASVASGVFMFGVHFLAPLISNAEYGVFGTMLNLLANMSIPTLGLQMVFTQQSAAALTLEQQKQLAATTRALLLTTLILWTFMAVTAFIFRASLLSTLQIPNPIALWITIGLGLVMLLTPIFGGLLLGVQNFMWYGWAAILNGAFRFTAACVLVNLGGGAAGMMGGALIGACAALAIYVWQSRYVWDHRGDAFDWQPWLEKVVPLTLGFGSFQFMFNADQIFVQSYFDGNQTGFYVAGGTLSRALVLFAGPLAAVMFPRVVRSLAKSEASNTLGLTLASTASMVGLGAVMLTLLTPWVIPMVYRKDTDLYLAQSGPLIPWYSASMVVLGVANVLMNNLMARGLLKATLWYVLVAAGYATTLTILHASFQQVIQVQIVFNLLYLLVGAWFTWCQREAKPAA